MKPFKAKPRKHKTYTAKRYTPKPIQPQTLPISSNHSPGISEEEQAAQQAQNPHELSSRPIKVIIEKDSSKARKSYWPNIIGWITAGISAAAVIAALDANQTTNKALAHQIEKDSLDDIADSIKHKEDSLNYREQFRLDSTSTQAQIDAFRGENRRFETENEPRLSIELSGFEMDQPTEKGKIKFKIRNYSKLAVTVTTSRFNLALSNEKPNRKQIIETLKTSVIENIFDVVSSALPSQERTLEFEQSKKAFDEFASGNLNLLLLLELRYVSPISGSGKIYRFAGSMIAKTKGLIQLQNWTENE